MPEKKVKVPWPPGSPTLVDGTEVQVKEVTERFTDVVLEDGSELRLKTSVFGVIRIDGKFDPEGNPMYVLKGNPIMSVTKTPEHLRETKTNTRPM